MRCSTLLLVFLVVAISSLGPTMVQSKNYMRCALAKELLTKYDINKTFLSNWICLVEHESSLDTRKTTILPDGTRKYGLFQISLGDCGEGRNAGFCKRKCKDFADDNIADDVVCAKEIFKRDGFKHWKGWNQSCTNIRNLPNLKQLCNI